jgi:hypothetical protein
VNTKRPPGRSSREALGQHGVDGADVFEHRVREHEVERAVGFGDGRRRARVHRLVQAAGLRQRGLGGVDVHAHPGDAACSRAQRVEGDACQLAVAAAQVQPAAGGQAVALHGVQLHRAPQVGGGLERRRRHEFAQQRMG